MELQWSLLKTALQFVSFQDSHQNVAYENSKGCESPSLTTVYKTPTVGDLCFNIYLLAFNFHWPGSSFCIPLSPLLNRNVYFYSCLSWYVHMHTTTYIENILPEVLEGFWICTVSFFILGIVLSGTLTLNYVLIIFFII